MPSILSTIHQTVYCKRKGMAASYVNDQNVSNPSFVSEFSVPVTNRVYVFWKLFCFITLFSPFSPRLLPKIQSDLIERFYLLYREAGNGIQDN